MGGGGGGGGGSCFFIGWGGGEGGVKIQFSLKKIAASGSAKPLSTPDLIRAFSDRGGVSWAAECPKLGVGGGLSR